MYLCPQSNYDSLRGIRWTPSVCFSRRQENQEKREPGKRKPIGTASSIAQDLPSRKEEETKEQNNSELGRGILFRPGGRLGEMKAWRQKAPPVSTANEGRTIDSGTIRFGQEGEGGGSAEVRETSSGARAAVCPHALCFRFLVARPGQAVSRQLTSRLAPPP